LPTAEGRKSLIKINLKGLEVNDDIDFDDDVYCCSVPNETIYVRLNGKPVWTGNSRH